MDNNTDWKYIDTHVHLYDEAFGSDFDETLARIKASGVGCCIFPAIEKASYVSQMECAEKCRGFAFEAIGLHPTSVGKNWKEELDFVRLKLSERNSTGTAGLERYVAVGEIGIDGYWSKEFIEEQKVVFKEQLLLANEYGLPAIIHVRDAMDNVFEVLDSMETWITGVFHAFSGSYETYCRLKKYGDIKIGIGGVVTYKNAGIATVLERVPLCDILLETDAPWLTPVPYRGKRNESSYLRIIAEKVAQIKGCDIEEVARQTTENAVSLFKLDSKLTNIYTVL